MAQINHITVDDIINFVSLTEYNSEAVEFCATVNGHLRACPKCLRLVTSFQMVYDEFSRLDMHGDFKKYVFEKMLSKNRKNTNELKLQIEQDEFDEFG